MENGSKDAFTRFVDVLEKIQMAGGMLCVAVVSVIIPLQVVCRYLLSAPLMWPEDIAVGLLVWLGFMGAAVLYKRNEHVVVEYFRGLFPRKLSEVVSIAIDLLSALGTLLIIIYGYDLNAVQMMTEQVGTGIPRGYFYSLPLFVNMIVLFIYAVHALSKRIFHTGETSPATRT